MSPVDDIRKSHRARWNKVLNAANQIAALMRNVDPDEVDGIVIADIRSHVEDITQCFHEFNAYSNAFAKLTGRQSPRMSRAELLAALEEMGDDEPESPSS